jgi:FkbM family methyltransferase
VTQDQVADIHPAGEPPVDEASPQSVEEPASAAEASTDGAGQEPLHQPDPAAEPQSEAPEPLGSKQEALLKEVRERLIHIELKTDGVLGRLAEMGVGSHPDQAFGGRTYAQFGEDLVILNIFQMLGVTKPSYLDIGAHHPFTISNTALLYARGSRGINVEANPNLIAAFQEHRHEDINLNVGVGSEQGTLDFYFIDEWSGRNTFSRSAAEAFVKGHPDFSIRAVRPIPVVTLDDIVRDYANGKFPHLLTLDVEGMELGILRAAAFNEDRPTVICVEADVDNPHAETAEISALLASRGYVPFTRTVANLLFVHQDAADTIGMHAVMRKA